MLSLNGEEMPSEEKEMKIYGADQKNAGSIGRRRKGC